MTEYNTLYSTKIKCIEVVKNKLKPWTFKMFKYTYELTIYIITYHFTVVIVYWLHKLIHSFAKSVFLYFIQLKLNTDFNFFVIFAKSVFNFNCIKYKNTDLKFANELTHLWSQYTLTTVHLLPVFVKGLLYNMQFNIIYLKFSFTIIWS